MVFADFCSQPGSTFIFHETNIYFKNEKIHFSREIDQTVFFFKTQLFLLRVILTYTSDRGYHTYVLLLKCYRVSECTCILLRMIQLQQPTAVLQLLAAVRSGFTSSDYCCMLFLLLYDRVCVQMFTRNYVKEDRSETLDCALCAGWGSGALDRAVSTILVLARWEEAELTTSVS